MASEKVSAMPVASALDGTELVMVVQGGVNKRCTVAALAAGLLHGLVNKGMLWNNNGVFAADTLMTRTAAAHLKAVTLEFTTSLIATTYGQVADGEGNFEVPDLVVDDGFTGSGAFTNFDVASGVVTNAT